jgi:hypothetical protein
MAWSLVTRHRDQKNALPNKRFQLPLQRLGLSPLSCGQVSSLRLVTSRFSLCSVAPRAPAGRN